MPGLSYGLRSLTPTHYIRKPCALWCCLGHTSPTNSSLYLYVSTWPKPKINTTFDNGSLGSPIDEERSETR